MITALKNATFFTGTGEVTGKALLIKNNNIVSFTDELSIPEEAHCIDCNGNYVSPGLTDLQVYGGGGIMFADQPSAASLVSMADSLVQNGTTSFLLTLATNSMTVIEKTLQVVASNPHPAILGVHLEGPFINPLKRGAHLAELIRQPDKKTIQKILDMAGGHLKMMTIAPEHFDKETIDLLLENDVILSAGHSNANFKQAATGFEHGITAVTHLFNAMPPLHHRDTGLVGAAFESGLACASIIADGIHVDYPTLSISKKIMRERLFLITDAVEESRNGSVRHVRKEDRFTLPDGTLSGSSLTMLKAVQNCVEKAGISLPEALRMASAYPAKLIHAERKGFILPGYDADLLIFTPGFKLVSVRCNC